MTVHRTLWGRLKLLGLGTFGLLSLKLWMFLGVRSVGLRVPVLGISVCS